MTLDEYFVRHYGRFESECEWYVDPTPNSCRFCVPSLNLEIRLDEDDGVVTEQRRPELPKNKTVRDMVIERLWDGLTDVPIDPKSEQLDESYYIWPKGTDREDIWLWFDKRHSKGVAYLLGFAE